MRKVLHPAFGPDHAEIDACTPEDFLVASAQLVVGAPLRPGRHDECTRGERVAHRQGHPHPRTDEGNDDEGGRQPAATGGAG
jgi:hypothetical protein